MEFSQVEGLDKQHEAKEGIFHKYGGVGASNMGIRNILWRSPRLTGSSSCVTMARIVLDTWLEPPQNQRQPQLLPLLSAPGALQPAGSTGELSHFHIYFMPVFLSASKWLQRYWKIFWTKLFWISHFLSLSVFFFFFFSLNNLLLVNETSCYLGKGRIGHDFQPSVCVCVCQCLSAQ